MDGCIFSGLMIFVYAVKCRGKIKPIKIFRQSYCTQKDKYINIIVVNIIIVITIEIMMTRFDNKKNSNNFMDNGKTTTTTKIKS